MFFYTDIDDAIRFVDERTGNFEFSDTNLIASSTTVAFVSKSKFLAFCLFMKL
jgi:hypothetical protein